jgi:hypothetical protein
MYAPAPDDELVEGVAFRLVKITDMFPRESPRPLPKHFEFSSEECDVAEKTGRWLISVWDRARTSPDQARAVMRIPAERAAFGFDVKAVRDVEVNGCRLSVVRDPLPPTFAGLGRSGHCGVTGLRCGTKNDRLQLRFQLSELATMRLD